MSRDADVRRGESLRLDFQGRNFFFDTMIL